MGECHIPTPLWLHATVSIVANITPAPKKKEQQKMSLGDFLADSMFRPAPRLRTAPRRIADLAEMPLVDPILTMTYRFWWRLLG